MFERTENKFTQIIYKENKETVVVTDINVNCLDKRALHMLLCVCVCVLTLLDIMMVSRDLLCELKATLRVDA